MDLPEIRILNTELGEREIVITVESTREWAICAKCGAEIREFHSYGRMLRLRHLPILGRKVIIEIRPKRFRCPTCDNNPTTTQKLDWYDERSPHTKAYDQWLLPQLIGSTITDAVQRRPQLGKEGVHSCAQDTTGLRLYRRAESGVYAKAPFSASLALHFSSTISKH